MRLTDLVRQPGPFATVHLDASHDTEDALDTARLRWRMVEENLAEAGAARADVAALSAAWFGARPPRSRAARLLVANGASVLLDVALADPPSVPVVRVGPLPYLLPVLLASQEAPHLVLFVDRTGLDYRVVTPRESTEGTIEGAKHPVHKVPGGGWSHLSMQRHVEETISTTMREAAHAVTSLARQAGARLVAVGGEVQARSALRAELPDSLPAVELHSATRAQGGDDDRADEEVTRALAELEATEHRADLDRYHAEHSSTDGIPAVVDALRTANVEVLLMRSDVNGRCWVAPGATIDTHPSPGTTECDLLDGLPAAALAVGARVRVVGSDIDLRDGVGAIRRYAA